MPGPKPHERAADIVRLLRRPSGRLPESLSAAAAAGDLASMERFIAQGADLEARSVGAASPLTAATSAGELEAMRWLIARGAKLDPPDAVISPIQSALGKGDCAAAAVLLEAGLPLDHAAWGIIAAALVEDLAMLRWLLACGIDLDAAYPRLGVLRERALRDAMKASKARAVAFLLVGGDGEPAPTTPPRRVRLALAGPVSDPAARQTLVAEARGLIEAALPRSACWKATGHGGSNHLLLIAYAARLGVIEVVEALLAAGAEPDADSEGNPTALAAAAEEAQLEVMRLLLARGAAPDGRDGKSWLPLQAAVQSGVVEAVRLLLDAGAKSKVKLAGGATLAGLVRGPYADDIRALLATSKH
jgi:hypothetical protein